MLARAGRTDLGELRRVDDALKWQVLAGGKIAQASVHWSGDTDDPSLANPASLGHLAGALSLMGDHIRAKQTFALAIANLDFGRHLSRAVVPRLLLTPTRDLAALIAMTAEAGEAQITADLVDRLQRPSVQRRSAQHAGEGMAAVAAHALNKDNTNAAAGLQ